MEEEDIRYDVFTMIYEMLFDNIELRVRLNKVSGRLISQATLNIDKTVSQFFRKNQKQVFNNIKLNESNFRNKLNEIKKGKRTFKFFDRKNDDSFADEVSLDDYDDEYNSE